MYVSKFVTLGLSALLECIGGVAYAFSLYSPALKESLHYTQFEINNVANPFIISQIIGLIPGIVFDRLQKHNRFGPRIILLIGASIHFIGYVGLWLAGTHRIQDPPYWFVVAMGVLAFNGATWNDVVFVSSNVRSFPHERGSAIGVLKALTGLSASMYAIIYDVTLAPDALNFILVIACAMPIAVIISFPFINAVPFRQPGELAAEGRSWSNSGRFSLVYGLIVLLSAFCFVASYVDVAVNRFARGLTVAGLVVICTPFLFLWLGSSGFWARPAEYCQLAFNIRDREEAEAPLEEPLLGGITAEQLGHETLKREESMSNGADTKWPVELTTRQSLSRLNFWLLFFVFGSSAACALLYVMNCGQLVQSLSGPEEGQDSLLSLFSIFNCLGRVVFGCLPEIALHRFGTPRCIFLVGTSFLLAIITCLTGLADVSLLWVTSPLCGFVYGANWSLVPALTSEFFGLSHFGINYCFLTTGVGIGSFLVSNVMGALIYQARARAHGDKHNICIGPDCFRLTFLLSALLEVLATIAAFVLWRRTAYIYAQEHREIKQEELSVQRHPQTGMRLVRQRHGMSTQSNS